MDETNPRHYLYHSLWYPMLLLVCTVFLDAFLSKDCDEITMLTMHCHDCCWYCRGIDSLIWIFQQTFYVIDQNIVVGVATVAVVVVVVLVVLVVAVKGWSLILTLTRLPRNGLGRRWPQSRPSSTKEDRRWLSSSLRRPYPFHEIYKRS